MKLDYKTLLIILLFIAVLLMMFSYYHDIGKCQGKTDRVIDSCNDFKEDLLSDSCESLCKNCTILNNAYNAETDRIKNITSSLENISLYNQMK